MTEPTATPAPAPVRRPAPEAVWARLLGDAGAFTAEHAGATLGYDVAFLVWEALILGHAQGVRDAAGRTREQLLAAVPDVAYIVDRAMAQAHTDDGFRAVRYPTLYRLAHAGERARAAAANAAAASPAPVAEDGGNCDG